MNIEKVLNSCKWLQSSHEYGSACICISLGKTIYIDPAFLFDDDIKEKADIICITHPHPDHYHLETIKKILKKETIIVSNPAITDEVKKNLNANVRDLIPGETINIEGILITGISAYSRSAHPKENNWLGFLIEIEGVKIYHTGDSMLTDEMKSIIGVDIMFTDVRDIYMMNSEETIKAASILKPKYLVPIHWIESEFDSISYIFENSPAGTIAVNLMKNI